MEASSKCARQCGGALLPPLRESAGLYPPSSRPHPESARAIRLGGDEEFCGNLRLITSLLSHINSSCTISGQMTMKKLAKPTLDLANN